MDREKLERLRTRPVAPEGTSRKLVLMRPDERDALFAYIDELERDLETARQKVKALDPYARGVVSASDTF
jgi:hypothetical protein